MKYEIEISKKDMELLSRYCSILHIDLIKFLDHVYLVEIDRVKKELNRRDRISNYLRSEEYS